MKPKCDGSFKVPKELVNEWNNGDQTKMLQEFQQAGLDKDPWGLEIVEPPSCIHSWCDWYMCKYFDTQDIKQPQFILYILYGPMLHKNQDTILVTAISHLQDTFIRKSLKRFTQKISESDLWVGGKFKSEKDMRDEGFEE